MGILRGFVEFPVLSERPRWIPFWLISIDDSAGEAAVLMLNRDLERGCETVLEFQDVAPARVLTCETLTGVDLKAVNTFADPRRLAPQPLDSPVPGARMTFKLPPRSYTIAHLAVSA